MAAMTNLQKHPKSGVYRFRRAVPPDLRPTIGKTEIVETLNTKDLTEAKRRVKEVGLRIDAMFDAARAGNCGITIGDVQQIAHSWKAEQLRLDEQERLAKPAFNATPTATIDLLNCQIEQELRLRELKLALDRRNYLPIEQTVSSLLQESGRAVDRRTEGFQAVCRALLEASIDVLQEQINRSMGDWADTPPPSLRPHQSPSAAQRRVSKGTPISTILERWIAERKPPSKTADEWRVAFKRFREVIGSDISIEDVSKDHVREFKQAMQRMPRVLSPVQRRKPLPDILSIFEANPAKELVTNTTINKQLGALSSVFSWAMDNGYIESNPASRVRMSIRSNRKTRIPYDDSDLMVIFHSTIYTGERSTGEPSTFWLPLMALWMGAREEELGQATVDDVREEGGYPYLRIDTIEDDQSTKNEGSQRSVPIHSQVAKCGFLDYVAALKAKGEKQLFPDLPVDKNGSHTSAWSKKINRFMRKLGITDKRKVFHSFRHNFKDACRRGGIEEAVHDALTGHTNGSVGRSYGMGYQVATLAEAMKKIDYPGLDLSHLQREPSTGSNVALWSTAIDRSANATQVRKRKRRSPTATSNKSRATKTPSRQRRRKVGS